MARTGALSNIWAEGYKLDGAHSGFALMDSSQATHDEVGVMSPLERTLAVMRQDIASFGSGMGEVSMGTRVIEEKAWPFFTHG